MEILHNPEGACAPDQTTDTFIDAHVTALSSDGRGIARIPQPDGRNIVCFIEEAFPGQQVRVRLTATKPRLLEGVVDAVLVPSPHERPAVCAHGITDASATGDACGGCPWQRLNYAEQCRWKGQMLLDSLQRIGKLDISGLPDLPFLASPQEWGFRNKMAFAFEQTDSGLSLGQRGRRSHAVVDLTDCRLQDALTMRVLAAMRSACTAHGPADWRHVVVRRPRGEAGTTLRVELIVGPRGRVRGEELYAALMDAVPEVTGFAVSLRRSETAVAQGEKTLFTAGAPDNLEILHRADGTELRLIYDDRSFLQVNTAAAEQLYAEAARLLDLSGHERLWDLYCGVGSIGLYLAPWTAEVRGIESVAEAVTNARANAEAAGFKHCHFEIGDSAKEFVRQARAVSQPTYGNKDTMPNVVVVDPPRAGLDKRVVTQLAALRPEKICYISCNPATLARDAALLAPTHALVAVRGVDLFPHTPHVEGVCLFQRKG